MNKVKLIVVNGIAKHGKDTFCDLFDQHYKGLVATHSTVATVKEAAKLFGADETRAKGDKERRLWSDMKDAWGRYNDGPFNEICDKFRKLEKSGEKAVLFAHVREPEEIAKLKGKFGYKCITLVVMNGNKNHVPDNHADRGVFDYEYEHVVLNNGTLEDLDQAAKEFAAKLAD